MNRLYKASILTLVFVLGATSVLAQWNVNGNQVSTSAGSELLHGMVSDGNGGVIIAWDGGSPEDRESQRLDPLGSKLWAEAAPLEIVSGRPVSDGNGGAFLVFGVRPGEEVFPVELHAQRIDAAGDAMWGTEGQGLGLVILDLGYSDLMVTPDGMGGLIVAISLGSSGSSGIHAQRIDGNGVAQWTADGIIFDTSGWGAANFQMISDGSGGAIIVWDDERNNGGENFEDIYAQRFLSNGGLAWAPEGIPVCTARDWQTKPGVCPDGMGGAIVSWNDGRNLTDTDVYAQCLDPNGTPLWTADGVVVSGYMEGQSHQQIAADGNGGAVLVWEDKRNLGSTLIDVYAQRIDGAGVSLWTPHGIPVNTADIDAQEPRVVCDDDGAAFIYWDHGYLLWDLYVQKVDPSGSLLWPNEGVAVCVGPQRKIGKLLVPDGEGGAFMSWRDERAGEGEIDIFAARIYDTGTVDAPSLVSFRPALLRNYPNPFNPSTTVAFELPDEQVISLRVFDVGGRLVDNLLVDELAAAGHNEVVWRGRDVDGKVVPAGVYLYRLEAGSYSETRRMTQVK